MFRRKFSADVVLWLAVLFVITEAKIVICFEYDSNGYTAEFDTKSGPVRGKEVSVFGEDVEVFLGIPYAQPPVGELRFRNPVPVEPWKDILLATRVPNSCPQEIYNSSYFEEWNTKAPLSEDCLFLNIWVPKKLRSEVNATVLIWIHGGGYSTGASTLDKYDGARLAVKNGVIVASMNYRIGALGFLHLDPEEAPGNMGLFDQHLAIKWIKENIESFGGNPNSLTLFGESAGGGSVSFHLLSPMSKNLSSRFIMQSGTANAPWSFKPSQEAQRLAFELASALDCAKNDTNEVIKCLRALPVKMITYQQDKLNKLELDSPFVPTVDGVFLPKSPEELIENGGFDGVQVIIGTTKDEGTMFVIAEQAEFFSELFPSPQLTNEDHASILRATFNNTKLHEIEKELIMHQYTNWEHYGDGKENAKMIIQVFGDYFFVCPVSNFAQKIKERGSKVFYYSFNQEKSVRKLPSWAGASHGDEIEFIFGEPLVSSKNYTDGERELSLNMMGYFTTFAKSGKPTLNETEWPEYSKESQNYMVLHENGNRLSVNGPRATACAFWNGLMPKLKKALEGESRSVPQVKLEQKTTNELPTDYLSQQLLS